jgi:gluconokinase
MSHKPTVIPGLRSPYDQVGGLVYFGRMVDKIGLHRLGVLPPGWVSALGNGFDGCCCRFLHISYADLAAEALKGADAETLLEWAYRTGRKPTDEEIEIWNAYLAKRGWKDPYAERLQQRLSEAGLPPDAALTMFDFIELDEGRPARLSG